MWRCRPSTPTGRPGANGASHFSDDLRHPRLRLSGPANQRFVSVKWDRRARKILPLIDHGQSYLKIGPRLGLSKNTVLDILKRLQVVIAAASYNATRSLRPIGAAYEPFSLQHRH
jgi:hypothetical protein